MIEYEISDIIFYDGNYMLIINKKKIEIDAKISGGIYYEYDVIIIGSGTIVKSLYLNLGKIQRIA